MSKVTFKQDDNKTMTRNDTQTNHFMQGSLVQ